ncbi:RMD1 family protein [Cohnella thailandensis]|uniref:RMD1 family protein n=1 Tax=Cohnella thailandensis TaxID=557557 RepID=A0A841SPR5_9BACL|nr:RMD1 family protein [Cohnella thailandensis]MBB6633192.1 RMD1 family protein [Cohnella thailandensis]MBP1975111.1 putative Rmd1/YagE family protein [Cohnella thailandensis]
MKDITFKAYAITNEIDLNKIAIHCGIPKKFTWEEPLILQGGALEKILQRKVDESQQVLVFSFGSVVFVNDEAKEGFLPFVRYLRTIEPNIDEGDADRYTDDYRLRVDAGGVTELTDEYVVVNEIEPFHQELIATVLAKSAALEKIEEQLGKIHDKLENMIDRLDKSNLRLGKKELARTTAAIMRHEYNTISYIMILDKPDITWASSSAGEFYDRMMEFFEMNDRYAIIKSKTEVLYRIMDGFSTISHSTRGLFVEWVIVLLIVSELAITVLQLVGWID